ncbi:MAG: response regulator [Actinobacteria bacterium]|uniref:Unannotated protein n=1 Tax=freshwater metagenome TaxID=449393 RepID=A0A6J7SI63_9ZZZZ|nr:response regulator [Actinomycetota bacterium]
MGAEDVTRWVWRVIRILAVLLAVVLGQFISSWSEGAWRLDVIVLATVARETKSIVLRVLAACLALITAFAVSGVSVLTTTEVLIALGESIAIALILTRCTRRLGGDALPALRFGVAASYLLLLIIVGAAVEALASPGHIDPGGTTPFLILVVLSALPLAIGVFFAGSLAARTILDRGAEPRMSKLSGAFVALALTGVAAQITTQYWSAQEDQTLSTASATLAASFQQTVSSDVDSLVARAGAAPRTPLVDQPAFDRWIKAFFFGNPSLSAVALVEGTPGAYSATYVTDRQGVALDLGPLLGQGPDDMPKLMAAGMTGAPFLLGVRSIPGADASPQPSLIYVAAITKAPEVAVQQFLVIAVSLPVAFAEATVSLGSLREQLILGLVEHSFPEGGPDTLAAGIANVNVAQANAIDQTSSTDAAFGDYSFSAVVTPGEGFGTPIVIRVLVLGGLGILGLGGVLLVLQAANSRARIRQELEEREGLLAAALDAAPGMVMLADSEYKVLVSNGTPANKQDRIGRHVLDVLPFSMDKPDAKRVLDLLADARLGNAGWIEHVDSISDSSLSIHVVSASPVESVRVGAAKLVVQVEDVTEQRARALRTAQSERLRSLGTMAGGLAHDFNNLLFIITGYLQLLQEHDKVAGDDQLSRYADRAVDAAERGAEIAASLLAVARSQPLEATAIEVGSFLKLMFPLVRQAIGAERLAILEIGTGQLDVLIDSGQLSSSVLNLVINARDAMEPGGTVRIGVERRFVDDPNLELSAQEYVVITVGDDGAGMTAAVAERAFEPYFSTKGVGHGTGIGLAAVHSFARQSGGLVTIDTELEVGTTVTIYLPAVFAQPDGDLAAGDNRQTLNTRILVVDDESALAFLVAGWLTEHGAEVRVAENSAQALRVAEEFRPDVLLTDVRLGDPNGVDGPELADAVTRLLPDISVIFMTGYSDRMHDLKARGMHTLAKPFTKVALARVLFPSEVVISRDDARGV